MQTLLKTTNAYKILSQKDARHHAYLLVYPDKESLLPALKIFAECFFEGNERAKALIASGGFADCIFLPGENKKCTVETVETLLEEAILRPVEGEEKLFVLSDLSEATAGAQNKLLKILEEPPQGVFFLLGTTVESPVLPTVLSRVEKLEIPPFSTAKITAYLKRKYPDVPFLKETATLSGGYPGKAEALLSGGILSEITSAAFELALSPLSGLPALAKKHGETNYKRELLSLLRMIFRDALFLKTGGLKEYLLLPSKEEELARLSGIFSLSALAFAQEALFQAEKDVKFNAVFVQTLELTLASIHEKNKFI